MRQQCATHLAGWFQVESIQHRTLGQLHTSLAYSPDRPLQTYGELHANHTGSMVAVRRHTGMLSTAACSWSRFSLNPIMSGHAGTCSSTLKDIGFGF